MSPSRKHHFIPACYLKQWAGADQQVCEYKRVRPGKIARRRSHPNATGFETDLYRIDGLPDDLAQSVETEFMKPVDGEADLALQKILRAAIEPWKERERSALTRFIFSLLYRQPEAVRELKEHIRDLHLASVESLREHYEQWRQPGDPPTLAEYLASEWPERQHRAAMNMLREIIDNIDVGPTINNMYWATVSVERSDVPLLTSDRPVVMPFGLGSANAYIALPAGPYVLFVAAHDARWANICETRPPQEIVEVINQAVVAQARTMVWGVDHSQLKFVEEWMSQSPDRPLLSEEQKRAAIAAAREDRIA